MKNLTIGLFLAAAILSVAGQQRHTQDRGGGRSTSHTTQRTTRTTQRQSYRGTNFGRTTVTRTNTGTAFGRAPQRSSYRGYGTRAPYNRSTTTSTFGLRRQPTRVFNQTNGDSRRFRPSGTGHDRAWFSARGWHQGPAYRAPIFQCYSGFTFDVMPGLYYTVWIYDPSTGEYYEAYYYPEYGYYAWVSNPLIAVGIYTPSVSFEIG